MPTEKVSSRYSDLDLWPTQDAVMAMLEAQLAAAAAVRPQVAAIAAAAEAAADRLRSTSGRIIYVGAGTSGRVAVQDGVELGPTFDWDGERLFYALAGGQDAIVTSAEDAEDDGPGGAAAMRDAGVGKDDVVIGIAASGTTPYTVAAIREADAAGALTIGIASNPGTPLLTAAKHAILLDTGAEVVAGSTRMKAGTAQKIALNLISTAIMIRLGRVYKGLMVNMRVSNHKLRERAIGMVDQLGGVGRAKAEAALEQAGGNIKLAVLLSRGAPLAAAEQALAEASDNLRLALARLDGTQVA